MITQPEWVERMPMRRWCSISGHRPDLGLLPTPPGTRYLEDNDPAGDALLNPARTARERIRRLLGRRPHSPWAGRCGLPSITEAWNGAVLATGFGSSGSMVVFGGGHNDYFGADMHAFDLHDREWRRIRDGYISSDCHAYGAGAVYADAEYPDGSPLPPHTYGYVQYDPRGNDFLLLKGQLELGPEVKAAAIPHLFNFDTLGWRRGPRHPNAILNAGGWTAWDARRAVAWVHSGDAGGGNAFLSFAPATGHAPAGGGRWGEMFPGKLPGEADHNAMTMDPARDVLVIVAHARNALCAIAPARPEAPLVTLTGKNQPPLAPFAAIEYSPNLDALVYYSAAEGAVVRAVAPPPGSSWHALTAGQWRWHDLLDEGNQLDPVADAARASAHEINLTHTFGRFRIATYASADVAILVRHIDSPVYAMRLT